MRKALSSVAVASAVLVCWVAAAGGKVPDTYTVAPGTPDSASVTPCTSTGTATFSCDNLRSAITAASGDDGSTVQLTAGDYTLTAGQVVTPAEGSFTIAGAGSGQTTIRQTTPGQRVLKLASFVATITIRGLTVTGGDQTTVDGSCTANTGEVDGGGIFNAGTLRLADVMVSANKATGSTGANASSGSAGTGEAANGGGICSGGPLTVLDSTISGNVVTGGDGGKATGTATGGFGGDADGGGIAAAGDLTVSGSTVAGNHITGGAGGKVTGSGQGGNGGDTLGGAILVAQGPGGTNPTASITDSRIENNSETGGAGPEIGTSGVTNLAGGAFGAIGTISDGAVTIARDTISGNSATGGAAGTRNNGATGMIGGSAGGAGVYSGAPLTMTASTVSGNTAIGGPASAAPGGSGGAGSGGGIDTVGIATIVNSTITGNALSAGSGSPADGGGIDNQGQLTLASDTIAANSVAATTASMAEGGNLDHESSSPITAGDTLIAGGSSGGTGSNCGHKVATDDGHNLESTAPSQCGFSAGAGDVIGADPLLGPLASNGGTTQTIALGAGSAAIAAGGRCADPTAAGQPLASDQRGEPRANPCDIGAFEGQPPTTTTGPSMAGTGAVGTTVSCSPGTYAGDPPLTPAFQWQRDGTAIAGATGSAYKVALDDADHKLSCQVTETNPYGHVTIVSAATTIPFPTPSLGRLHQSHKRWRRGSKLAKVGRSRGHATPVGTTFSFTLNVPSRLTMTFRRGHKKAGTLSLTAKHAGTRRIRFDGRLSTHRGLADGHYTLSITATAHGKRSKPRTATFTIVGG